MGPGRFRFYVRARTGHRPGRQLDDAGFRSRYQAELANGLGNLVNRSLSMLKRYRGGIVPPTSNELAADVAKTSDETRALSSKTNCRQRCKASGDSSTAPTNTWIKPRRSDSPKTRRRRSDSTKCFIIVAETCRVLAVLLCPVLPGTAVKVYVQLGFTGSPDNGHGVAFAIVGILGAHCLYGGLRDLGVGGQESALDVFGDLESGLGCADVDDGIAGHSCMARKIIFPQL